MLLSEHNAVMMRWRPIIRLAGIPVSAGILLRNTARPSCSLRSDGPRVAARKLWCRYFDTVWAAVARCHIMERLPQLIRRDKVAIQLGK